MTLEIEKKLIVQETYLEMKEQAIRQKKPPPSVRQVKDVVSNKFKISLGKVHSILKEILDYGTVLHPEHAKILKNLNLNEDFKGIGLLTIAAHQRDPDVIKRQEILSKCKSQSERNIIMKRLNMKEKWDDKNNERQQQQSSQPKQQKIQQWKRDLQLLLLAAFEVEPQYRQQEEEEYHVQHISFSANEVACNYRRLLSTLPKVWHLFMEYPVVYGPIDDVRFATELVVANDRRARDWYRNEMTELLNDCEVWGFSDSKSRFGGKEGKIKYHHRKNVDIDLSNIKNLKKILDAKMMFKRDVEEINFDWYWLPPYIVGKIPSIFISLCMLSKHLNRKPNGQKQPSIHIPFQLGVIQSLAAQAISNKTSADNWNTYVGTSFGKYDQYTNYEVMAMFFDIKFLRMVELEENIMLFKATSMIDEKIQELFNKPDDQLQKYCTIERYSELEENNLGVVPTKVLPFLKELFEPKQLHNKGLNGEVIDKKVEIIRDYKYIQFTLKDDGRPVQPTTKADPLLLVPDNVLRDVWEKQEYFFKKGSRLEIIESTAADMRWKRRKLS